MVRIKTTYSWDGFRKFIVTNTCKSFIPNNYIKDPKLFPQGNKGHSDSNKENSNKFILKKLREVTVVNVKRVIRIIHSTIIESTNSKRRHRKKINGKFMDTFSNSSVNYTESNSKSKSKVLTKKWLKRCLKLPEESKIRK